MHNLSKELGSFRLPLRTTVEEEMPAEHIGETTQCKLCKKFRVLRNSHIIPEFLYKSLYDTKHRFIRVSASRTLEPTYEQKGVREKLLCNECEVKFSSHETYARGVLYGGAPIDIISNSTRAFEAHLDYKKFKLFQLSILWRIGITALPEFKSVKLGKHEGILRQMLLQDEPGETATYGCILTWPPNNREIVDQVIMDMGTVRIGRVKCFRLILGGMHWLYFLSKRSLDVGQKGLFLQSNGLIRILKSDFGSDKFIKNLAKEFKANNPRLFDNLA